MELVRRPSGHASDDPIIPGRSCGSCSLCCKCLRVDELEKPEGEWCRHCAVRGAGCTIYETRPSACATFYCLWLTSDLGPEWKPTRAKFVLYVEGDGNRLVVHVDPGFAQVWRNEPYYSQLKEWAHALDAAGGQVCVYIRRRCFVILPDRDVDLGEFVTGDHIMVSKTRTPAGLEWDAFKRPREDVPVEDREQWLNARVKSL